MDYRSAIQLSYENKQKALKEAQKLNGSNGISARKEAGPSGEAIKNFLQKQREKDLAWFEKLKVEKQSAKPAKPSKAPKEAKSDAKSKTKSVKDAAVKEKKVPTAFAALPRNEAPMKDVPKKDVIKKELPKMELPKKVVIKKELPKKELPKKEVPKEEATKKPSKKALPHFSKYTELLAMAQQNATKPSEDWFDPDKADRKEASKKVKRKEEDRQDFSFFPSSSASSSSHFPTKRKTLRDDANGAPETKKAKKSEKYEASRPGNVSNLPSSTSQLLTPSSRHRPTEMTPPPRRGIAAQLNSAQLPFAGVRAPQVNEVAKPRAKANDGARPKLNSLPSSKTSTDAKPKVNGLPSSKAINDVRHKVNGLPSSKAINDVRHKASSDARPKMDDVSNVHAKSSKRGGIAAQNSTRPLPPPVAKKTTAPPAARPPKMAAMSVTMEDEDSNFIQYTRKHGTSTARSMPPPPQPAPRRGGIASQNGVSDGKISKFGSFRFAENSEEEEDDYDEEDDFIDDSDLVSENQYKSVVAEIHRSLRFDPNRYEKVTKYDDLRSMESNYKEIEKEEKRSARLGMKEDLDDIRLEQERLKQKKAKHK